MECAPGFLVSRFDAEWAFGVFGAKLDWHIHPGGQILLKTEGTGYYQETGKPVQTVHKGDVLKCTPGVAHWHGAAPESTFAYIAVFAHGKRRNQMASKGN